MKRIVALAALLTAAPSLPQGTYEHDEAAIVRLDCGAATGTAFKVSATGYLTALHVVKGRECYVAGQRVTVTSLDEPNDYATFIGPASGAMLPTDCGDFRPGRQYVARGYAGGGFINAFMPWLAAGSSHPAYRQFHTFIGTVFPGMSGGPVIDGEGRVVGVVSKMNPTMATTLSRTGYCKR